MVMLLAPEVTGLVSMVVYVPNPVCPFWVMQEYYIRLSVPR